MVGMDEDILDILFVGEDEGLAEMYRLKLELDGYRVRIINPQQTRSIGLPLPSLVFLEVKGVDREALRFLSDLRSNSLTKDLPVMMLTDCREEELRQRGVRLGARDYLVRVSSPRAEAQGLRQRKRPQGAGPNRSPVSTSSTVPSRSVR